MPAGHDKKENYITARSHVYFYTLLHSSHIYEIKQMNSIDNLNIISAPYGALAIVGA